MSSSLSPSSQKEQLFLNITPKIAQLTSSNPSISEIDTFHSLEKIGKLPSNRPYTWSNSVASLDGITSFKTKLGTSSSPKIALSGLSEDSFADWRLLEAGWAQADAVLGSGEILRVEKTIRWIPSLPDLIEYRTKVLNKPNKYPINVVLSGSGDMPGDHPLFLEPDVQTIVFSSISGSKAFQERIEKAAPNFSPPIQNSFVVDDAKWDSILIESFNLEIIYQTDRDHTDDPSRVVLEKMVHVLRERYNVHHLDVTAGSQVLGDLVQTQLLDEYRLTQSGLFLGGSGTPKKASERPSTLSFGEPFEWPKAPLLKYEAIRLGFHAQHLFLRCSLDYSQLTNPQQKL